MSHETSCRRHRRCCERVQSCALYDRGPRPCPRYGPVAASGFSLVEVLVATALLATAVASLASLFALATRANLDAGDVTWATVLAAQKIEELRAAPFPERPVDPAVEYIDSGGERLEGTAPAGGRVYTRRWWVEPLHPTSHSTSHGAPGDTVAITVVVSRYRRADDGTPVSGDRPEGIARVVTLRTRRVP